MDLSLEKQNATIAVQVLQHFLFSKQQIPFRFDTFKDLADKKKGIIDHIRNYQARKQLKNAIETVEQIKDLKSLIISKITGPRSKIMILFGTSISTASQAFLIEFPTHQENFQAHPSSFSQQSEEVNMVGNVVAEEEFREVFSKRGKRKRKMNEKQQQDENQSKLMRLTLAEENFQDKKILLKLIQNENLMSFLNEHEISTTKTHILFHLDGDHDDLTEIRSFKLHKNCRRAHIKFKNYDIKSEEMIEVRTFDPTVRGKDSIKKFFEDNDEWHKTSFDIEEFGWFKTDKNVKGFNDELVNGESIWNV